jgi:hypothetical protein
VSILNGLSSLVNNKIGIFNRVLNGIGYAVTGARDPKLPRENLVLRNDLIARVIQINGWSQYISQIPG